MNPPIPTKPCSVCGKLTNETHSKIGVACYDCFQKHDMTPAQISPAPAPNLKLAPVIPHQVNDHAIALVEHALEQLRSGEFQHIAFAMQTAEGETITAHSAGEQRSFTMIGALEYLKLRYMQERIQSFEE